MRRSGTQGWAFKTVKSIEGRIRGADISILKYCYLSIFTSAAVSASLSSSAYWRRCLRHRSRLLLSMHPAHLLRNKYACRAHKPAAEACPYCRFVHYGASCAVSSPRYRGIPLPLSRLYSRLSFFLYHICWPPVSLNKVRSVTYNEIYKFVSGLIREHYDMEPVRGRKISSKKGGDTWKWLISGWWKKTKKLARPRTLRSRAITG